MAQARLPLGYNMYVCREHLAAEATSLVHVKRTEDQLVGSPHGHLVTARGTSTYQCWYHFIDSDQFFKQISFSVVILSGVSIVSLLCGVTDL